MRLEDLKDNLEKNGYKDIEIRGKQHPILYIPFTENSIDIKIEITTITTSKIELTKDLKNDASNRDILSTTLHIPLYNSALTYYEILDFLHALPSILSNTLDLNLKFHNNTLRTKGLDLFQDDPIRLLRVMKELVEKNETNIYFIGRTLNSYLKQLQYNNNYQYTLWNCYINHPTHHILNRRKINTKINTIFQRYPLGKIFHVFSIHHIFEIWF